MGFMPEDVEESIRRSHRRDTRISILLATIAIVWTIVAAIALLKGDL